MKYCKKCGMLLEDTQDVCIGCGLDVSLPENTSEFPPELAAKMENKKEQDKKKNVILIAIIIIFVLLAVLIGIFVAIASKNASEAEPPELPVTQETETDTQTDQTDVTDDVSTGVSDDDTAATKRVVEDDREVSDNLGDYYLVGNVYDDLGNLMFTTLYPEEFGSITATFDYEKFSDIFPLVLNVVVCNEDDTLRLTYTSPEHFWYQNSSKGNSRYNEVDLDYYMSFLTYDGPQAYMEALVQLAYPGAKSIEMLESVDASDSVKESLNLMLKQKTKRLTGDIGDYAHIGDTTTYAAGESACSATIYKYHVVNKSGQDVFADFYLPIISNTFYYANEQIGDQGSVTEWLPLCVISYESGNQETYEFYENAFKVFVNNSNLTKEFFRINEEYGKVIDEAVANRTDPEPMNETLLTTLTERVKESNKLNELDTDIYDFLNTPDGDLPTFSNTSHRVTGVADSVQAFYSDSLQRVFITPSDTEYPGNEYVDLFR
ncbi:MAG: hypothetical protein K6G22_12570 [Lachnospiraceae bacterium]|nr:hypothetical protein [Lachnospiraceae bacterium]